MNLNIKLIDKEITYTGHELKPHFLLTEFGQKGSALAAFIGPCEVQMDELVDWEDRLNNDFIRSKKMLHFIGEFFGMQLREAVFLQRLIMARFGQSLNVTCEGDDLYHVANDGARRKLSVSIVTATPVSQLLHIGINIDPEGAPVDAVGLDELGVDAMSWAQQSLQQIQKELAQVEWACAKVRPVV